MIEDSLFYKKISSEYISGISKDPDFIKRIRKAYDEPPASNREISFNEYYIQEILNYLLKQISIISKIRFCLDQMKFETKKLNNLELRFNKIQIYLSTIYISVSSLYDITLKLINAVLYTGINGKDVNQKLIEGNIFIKNTKVATGLKQFNRIINKDIIKRRNQILHEHKNDFLYDRIDPTVISVINMLIISDFSDFEDPTIAKLFKFTKKAFKEEVTKFSVEINIEIVEIENCLLLIFEGLEIIYNKRRKNNGL